MQDILAIQSVQMIKTLKVAQYSFSAGQYLPSLSVNYVAINKDLENWHRSCIR